MSPEYHAALLVTAQALPAGTAVPILRETLIELLRANGTAAPLPTERMLKVVAVAEMLGTTKRWVYAHANQLGGKRLSRRCLRFPESVIRRRMERRR